MTEKTPDLAQLRSDAVLDTVGLFCPVPIIRTASLVKRLEAGQVLEVLSDDQVILIDMPSWCRSHGHAYLGWRRQDGTYHLYLRKTSDTPRPDGGRRA
ncbi:MAG TPA: sulfurtransferase TusA family protein [Candidatus Polarisedimenticolia bacterium]|nr:sulfurtransferase TusA family protein [Candidatus Polarisedimenticolia bacterium]